MKTLGELQNFTEDTSAEGGNNYLMCVYQSVEDPNQKGGVPTALVVGSLATDCPRYLILNILLCFQNYSAVL